MPLPYLAIVNGRTCARCTTQIQRNIPADYHINRGAICRQDRRNRNQEKKQLLDKPAINRPPSYVLTRLYIHAVTFVEGALCSEEAERSVICESRANDSEPTADQSTDSLYGNEIHCCVSSSQKMIICFLFRTFYSQCALMSLSHLVCNVCHLSARLITAKS